VGAPECWIPAWIGVGSNLADPAAQVRSALDQMAKIRRTRLVARSSLYRNPPMGPVEQPDFVNAVAGLLTQLSPRELLNELQDAERAAGRQRESSVRWGPRPLDLDLLSYGLQRVEERGLTVPHPGIAQRNFVLLPLAEVAPGLQIPGLPPLRFLAASQDCDAIEPMQ
jgi:2-amino-4-hydroxy-6-hydroxymethyldihydropteridine diphosphokinase